MSRRRGSGSAAAAALFALASLQFYLRTHRLIGVLFTAGQMWFVVAFLIRRPARAVAHRPRDWLLAFGGTFGGQIYRRQVRWRLPPGVVAIPAPIPVPIPAGTICTYGDPSAGP
jgi:hypothetical protein